MDSLDDKPRTEVVEETRESLAVLDLDRKPRPQKMAAERAFFDGAHEVRYTERTFRPKHGADLDDIRTFIDSLEVRRREVPALPQPAPVHVEARPQVPDHYRGPLERAIAGTLVSVETVHRVGTGTVVDVAWETSDGALQRGLYLIVDDEARPYTDVATKIDDLPAPSVPPAVSPETQSGAASAAPAPPPTKKRLLGFGKRSEAPAPAPPPAEAPADEPRKKRFGFGKR